MSAVTIMLVRLQHPMMSLDSGFTVKEIFPLKPLLPPMILMIEFPFPPRGIETDDGLAEIEKSDTKRVSTVSLRLLPFGVPVTVTKVALVLSGVERLVLIVSMLELPARSGVTVLGENEIVTPAGRIVLGVIDKVTGLGGIEPLSVKVIVVEPELPLMTSMFPELDNT